MKRIQLPSNGKRALSFLIDFLIVAGLVCFFYFIVFSKAVSAVQNFPKLKAEVNQERLDSKLYGKDSNNKAIYLFDSDPSIKGDTVFKEHIQIFYTDYLNKKDSKYNEYYYKTHVLFLDDFRGTYSKETIEKPKEIIYEWDNKEKLTYKRKDQYKENDELDFSKLSLNNSIVLLNKCEPIRTIINKTAWGTARAWLYSSMVGTLIPCLIVPLCLKNGKTVGKLVMHLIVLTDEGYYYKRYKLIFRYLALYFIEVFGGFITITLTFILSGCLVLFSKKKRALHDFIAFSVVADEKQTVFYLDKAEENKYIELAKNIKNK